jgi:outer membrane protein assembly factor BamB/orotate phosphoribosyltransferase
MKSDILLEIIKNKVFREEEIQTISLAANDEVMPWLFDFKSVALSRLFLEEYARLFWETLYEYEGKGVQIGGMESGAIPLVAGLSLFARETSTVNPFYIRKSRKKGDLANSIEGKIKKGLPLILVDDILNNGATMKKQIAILEESGYKVNAIFVCVRFRDLSFYKEITDKGIRIESIFELDDLSGVLPVKNLTSPLINRIPRRYKIDYKVTLTDRPNLYTVLPKSGPVLSGDSILIGADDGTFYALSKDTGAVLWTYKVHFGANGKRIFSTCAVWKEFVIFGAYDGNLYCLNKETGKVEWVFMDADWIGSSPCVDPDRGIVFIGLEFGLFKKHGGVAAIDIKTGKPLWKNYSMAGLTHASPTYNKKHNVVVCGSNDNNIYAFDATSGTLLWKYETQGEIKYGAVFDDRRDSVCLGSMDGGVYVLRVQGGSLYHRFEARFGFYSTPVIANRYLYIGSLDKRVYCFDLENKKTAWAFETGGRIFASPLLDGDSLFIGSNDGMLYEIHKDTGKLLHSLQLTERIVNRIQLDQEKNGKKVLYVGTHLCELYRIIEE